MYWFIVFHDLWWKTWSYLNYFPFIVMWMKCISFLLFLRFLNFIFQFSEIWLWHFLLWISLGLSFFSSVYLLNLLSYVFSHLGNFYHVVFLSPSLFFLPLLISIDMNAGSLRFCSFIFILFFSFIQIEWLLLFYPSSHYGVYLLHP